MKPKRRRRALVTGGSGELGRAIALALAADHDVIVHARSRPAAARAVARDIAAAGGRAEVSAFDIADAAACADALEKLLADGPIDCFVHNAGIHRDGPLAGMAPSDWQQIIAVNLAGFFNCVQPLLLPMARLRRGRVIAISSVAAVLGNRGQTSYAAAKAGLHGAVRSLSREMGSRGLTANAVAPGILAAGMADGGFSDDEIKRMVPAGRAGTADEVAALVGFLASDAAAYISGQVISVDGGMS